MIEYKGYRAVYSEFNKNVSISEIATGKTLTLLKEEHFRINYAQYVKVPTPEAFEIRALSLFIACREILKESVNALRRV